MGTGLLRLNSFLRPKNPAGDGPDSVVASMMKNVKFDEESTSSACFENLFCLTGF